MTTAARRCAWKNKSSTLPTNRIMQRLISEITRLYLRDGQRYCEQDDPAHAPLSTSVFEQHLLGVRTIALELIADQGLTRTLVLDFDTADAGKGEQNWRDLCVVANALQEQLKLPAPAVSISGRAGYGLWLSLAEPVPATDAREFAYLLRKQFLPEAPHRPDHWPRRLAEPPPCRQPNGKWAAFIHPSMGASFAEDPALEMAPPIGAQVGFLEGLQSITLAQFALALKTLRHDQPPVASPISPRAAVPDGLLLKDASIEDIVQFLHSKNIEPTFRYIKVDDR
jgi:hypothetical protein